MIPAVVSEEAPDQIEAGTIPWVQPWAEDQTLSIPRNAATNRAYSGINILLLWEASFTRGFAANRWLTFKQALTLGGNVRKGERGTTVVYADTFTPKMSGNSAPSESDDSGRRVPFLKRFTVFNVAQCGGLPFDYTVQVKPVSQALPIPTAEALIAATGANFNRTDTKAYYHIGSDTVYTPPQESFFEPSRHRNQRLRPRWVLSIDNPGASYGRGRYRRRQVVALYFWHVRQQR